jgi:murein DD-endopeptidase MepM/ murein hydrolase activator NlpD
MKSLTPYFLLSLFSVVLLSCTSSKGDTHEDEIAVNQEPEKKENFEFGFDLDQFTVVRDTVKSGETFGIIMDRHHVYYPTIHKIISETKDSMDLRKIKLNNPYTILKSKDSAEVAQVFIYKQNKISYSVVDFRVDTLIQVYKYHKPIKKKIRYASGIIEKNKSLIQTHLEQDLDPNLAYYLADDIYAWTLDFTKLYPEDKFKIIYEEKFIEDSTYVGVGQIKAAYVEHKGTDLYAFRFIEDTTTNYVDFYDEEHKNLRRAFLKSPIKFNYRISSKYNLKRKIPLYGRTKAHKGTDFAADYGTPIMSTANGKIVASRYTKANGNYVKVKHNKTYSTQYLHMQKRKAKVGDYVKQGDIIGYVGSTGYSSGPHVCYRFWKNGRQVDPFKQKLPAAKAMDEAALPRFEDLLSNYKKSLDEMAYPNP